MLTSFYALSFVFSILALAGWFYFQNKAPLNKRLRQSFFAGMAVYLLSVIFSVSTFEYKLGILFRDLFVMGGSGLAFLYLARQKKAFIVGLIVMLAGLGWFFKTKLQPSFSTETGITLDSGGELLVELSENRSIQLLKDILQKYDLDVGPAFQPLLKEQTELDDYYVINIPARYERKIGKIKKELYASGIVDWVEGNEVINISPLPARRLPEVNRKFGINDPGLEYLWGFEAMEVDKLYNFIKKENIRPKQKALIAILDTGVDAKHEDIKGNYRSTQKKYNDDPKGHGTHCAGIAAAVSNNGLGVASFSPNNEFVEITSIKVLSSAGMGTQRGIINGIIEAADKGAAVISLSLGGRSNQSKQTAYRKAVKYANKAGAIVVAAAGNANRNAKDFAPVNAEGVLGVSAIDPELNRAVFSNYVTDIKMAVAAPGVNIYSTFPGNKYATFNGTSMATPYVAGLVGLMKSLKPSLTTAQIHTILSDTGKETNNTAETGKLILPAEALKAVQ